MKKYMMILAAALVVASSPVLATSQECTLDGTSCRGSSYVPVAPRLHLKQHWLFMRRMWDYFYRHPA